jgi:hypothetical protein
MAAVQGCIVVSQAAVLETLSVQFVTANGATIPALGFGNYGVPWSDTPRLIRQR